MKKTTIFALLTIFVLGAILSVSFVNAYKGDYSIKGPECTEERHAFMMESFDNLDYNAWKELMSANGKNSRVLEKINEENFPLFVEAHNAGKSGNYELAKSLRLELGLNNGQGPRDGKGFGLNKEFQKGTGNRFNFKE